jgi:hypothetical protein
VSTDVSRSGPACDCPCTLGGSPSLDALAKRPFSLVSKRMMRLLPPLLGSCSPPHAGAYLQMGEGSRDGNSAAVISRPSLSILTHHMHSTTDDPCQVLKIAILRTSTVVRIHRLLIGDFQASNILLRAPCLLMRHECYRTPTGRVLADGRSLEACDD